MGPFSFEIRTIAVSTALLPFLVVASFSVFLARTCKYSKQFFQCKNSFIQDLLACLFVRHVQALKSAKNIYYLFACPNILSP